MTCFHLTARLLTWNISTKRPDDTRGMSNTRTTLVEREPKFDVNRAVVPSL